MTPNQSERKPGKDNYGREETQHMLNILKEILLISPNEWQQVIDMHSVTYVEEMRYVEKA